MLEMWWDVLSCAWCGCGVGLLLAGALPGELGGSPASLFLTESFPRSPSLTLALQGGLASGSCPGCRLSLSQGPLDGSGRFPARLFTASVTSGFLGWKAAQSHGCLRRGCGREAAQELPQLFGG